MNNKNPKHEENNIKNKQNSINDSDIKNNENSVPKDLEQNYNLYAKIETKEDLQEYLDYLRGNPKDIRPLADVLDDYEKIKDYSDPLMHDLISQLRKYHYENALLKDIAVIQKREINALVEKKSTDFFSDHSFIFDFHSIVITLLVIILVINLLFLGRNVIKSLFVFGRTVIKKVFTLVISFVVLGVFVIKKFWNILKDFLVLLKPGQVSLLLFLLMILLVAYFLYSVFFF